MRPLLSYFLLVLAAIQCSTTLLLPLAQLSTARNRASLRLRSKTDGDETFVLHSRDFERSRSGAREWWHDGLLYDLKWVDMQGDSAHIVAVADHFEQQLLAGFQHLFSVHSDTPAAKHPLSHLLIELFAQPFLPVDYAWTLPPPLAHLIQHNFSFQAEDLAGFARIFSPPPKWQTLHCAG